MNINGSRKRRRMSRLWVLVPVDDENGRRHSVLVVHASTTVLLVLVVRLCWSRYNVQPIFDSTSEGLCQMCPILSE